MNEKEPKFRQLAMALRDRIEQGEYHPGEVIPSEPQLQEQFNVSRNTVRDAVELLVQDGYLQKKRGRWSGTIVLERQKKLLRIRKGLNFGTLGSELIIDSGESDVPPVSRSIIRELDKFEASLSLFPFLSPSHPEQLAYVKKIIARNLVDGFFLWNSSDISSLSNYLLSVNFPFVYISTNLCQSAPSGCPLVYIDERNTVTKTIRGKKKTGKKKLVLLAGRNDLLPNRTHALMKDAAKLHGLEYQCLDLTMAPFMGLVEEIRRHSALDTFFVTGNELVESVDNAVSLLKLKVPEEMDLILFKHYSPDWRRWEGKYPIIDRPYDKLGQCAVRVMQKVLMNKDTGLSPMRDLQMKLNSFCC